MSDLVTFGSLSPEWQRLVRLIQQVNHGRIENFLVQYGVPDLEPLPRIVHHVQFGAENGPRPEAQIEDFVLKGRFLDVLRYFEEHPNCVVHVLHVKHGLPYGMDLEDVA